jgi:hypothetical protein
MTYMGALGCVTIWPMAEAWSLHPEWRKHRGLTQEQLAERIGIEPRLPLQDRKRQAAVRSAVPRSRRRGAAVRAGRPDHPRPIRPGRHLVDLGPAEAGRARQVVEIAKTLKRTGTEG